MVTGASGNILNGVQQRQLTAIKTTARLVDAVQERLASGESVNSAIDDPSNFFTSKSLNFRASDLARRLDGIGQSIRTVQVAENGVEASLNIIDQTEAFLQDTLEQIEAGALEFQINTGNGVPSNVTQILPSTGDIISYGGGQDLGGPATVTNGGQDILLDQNQWKRLAINYTVTANTFLEFDFQSTAISEISGIGFDNDVSLFNDNTRFFLNGTQSVASLFVAPLATHQYTGAGAYEHYTIPVGAFFTGAFSHLTLFNDDDAGPIGNAAFQNIFLREGPTQAPPDATSAPPGVQEQYTNLLDQLDRITVDANYRGINLLKSETLETVFNENGTSRLKSEGIDATSNGLGLLGQELNSLSKIQASIDTLREARETLRGYATTLASDLQIIQTREDFTRNIINTLYAGSDDLILDDANKTGAELLALQVREQVAFSTLARQQASVAELL